MISVTDPVTAPVVHVRGLVKTFMVPEREVGLRAAVKSLFRRTDQEVNAVADLSFDVAAGEVVGFLGPNGAGKTTTLKMLSGILHPTAGDVRVLGHEPARRRPDYLRRITLLMGNRNQLQWDLPADESFELNRAIYRIPWPDYRRIRAELIETLEIGDLVRKPVRNLSLGERMKVEVAGSLLHKPTVLFLDEPTIGLDLTTQKRIRSFIGDYAARHAATVLLTSHYMADIKALCRRVIVIADGRILVDERLSALAARMATYQEIEVTLGVNGFDPARFGTVTMRDGDRVRLRVARDQAAAVTSSLINSGVTGLTIEDPPIEDVIEMVFAGATTS